MFEVIGIKEIDYINKSGKRVIGKTLYLAFQTENIQGVGAKEIFVNNEVCPPDIHIKDTITVLYNEYGGVARIEYINK